MAEALVAKARKVYGPLVAGIVATAAVYLLVVVTVQASETTQSTTQSTVPPTTVTTGPAPSTDTAPAELTEEVLESELESYESRVNELQQELENLSGSNISIAQEMKIQFQMQVLTQYIEAVSNTLSEVNQEMLTMANAVKGQ